ncbi:MAG: hypothetical protein U9O89_06180 [Thermoproteota archaeon]|nr:hypothetical protein [Thermoproteota archaeon]
MKKFFFPYKRVQSDIFGKVLIPAAKIFLRGQEEIGIDVVVDSGAVISIFPRSLSDLLNLVFDDGKTASVKSATGEEIHIRIHRVGMRIGDFSFHPRVAFSTTENIPYVLGRLDVFGKVEIRFEQNGTSFLIE